MKAPVIAKPRVSKKCWNDPQVWRGLRQGNIALIHSAPTSCCGQRLAAHKRQPRGLLFVAFSLTGSDSQNHESGGPFS
jgi:hypothetical protein